MGAINSASERIPAIPHYQAVLTKFWSSVFYFGFMVSMSCLSTYIQSQRRKL